MHLVSILEKHVDTCNLLRKAYVDVIASGNDSVLSDLPPLAESKVYNLVRGIQISHSCPVEEEYPFGYQHFLGLH